jgi:two-component system, NarL family, nitrate/nitrite response regulator NarL
MARAATQAQVRSTRVLLADDHRLIRLALREELEEAGFEVCAEAATAAEAVEAAVREDPDLCLLDISMPGSGLHAAAQINLRLPSTKLVMLTASSKEEHLLEAVRAGACGYLLKEHDPTRLPIVLRDVLAGVPAFPRRLTRPLVVAARTALGPPSLPSE